MTHSKSRNGSEHNITEKFTDVAIATSFGTCNIFCHADNNNNNKNKHVNRGTETQNISRRLARGDRQKKAGQLKRLEKAGFASDDK